MRFAELFAGAGGMSLGLERAGWHSVWHAEIADAPRAILTHRWPSVPLYGDVTTLDGRALTATHGPIDLLAGGSPCQDLSVAGKRAGMAEGSGTRSSLFYEQMRLWDETSADLCLWENVDGARSSNEGKDFGHVLRAFVGAAVPVPSDGWRSAGVAAGPRGVAAWRVLDAQFFGVPQRRRRVFVLGTRTGSVDPAQVLSLAESLRGDSPESGETREGSADSAHGGVAFALRGRDGGAQLEVSGSVTSALRGAGGGSSRDMVFDTLNNSTDDIAHTLRSNLDRGSGWGGVLAFGWQNSPEQGDSASDRVTPALDRSKVPAVCITGEQTHALTHEGADASEDGTGRGTPIVANAICAREAKGWEPESQVGNGTITHGIPRRLTPRECERLMDWPDDWTLVLDAKGKPLSDAARYKACGNGVASCVAEWIGERLRVALEASLVHRASPSGGQTPELLAVIRRESTGEEIVVVKQPESDTRARDIFCEYCEENPCKSKHE